MTGYLGYGSVPQGQTGWNGGWGAVPIVGPPAEPCADCGKTEKAHPRGYDAAFGRCARFRPAPDVPKPEEIVEATVVTEWTCHACGYTQDVWGEGAVGGWMECQNPECDASSWLELAV